MDTGQVRPWTVRGEARDTGQDEEQCHRTQREATETVEGEA